MGKICHTLKMQYALLGWTIRQLVSLSTVLPLWTKIKTTLITSGNQSGWWTLCLKVSMSLGGWRWARTLGFQDLAYVEPTEFPKVIESSRGDWVPAVPGQPTGLSAERSRECLFINRPRRFSVKVTFQIFKKHNMLFINLFCVHVWVGACVSSCTRGGQRTRRGAPFRHAGTGPRDRTRIVTLGGKGF